MDARIARRWRHGSRVVTVFVEASNLTDRRNVCCLDFDLAEDGGDDQLERGRDFWPPLLPAVGVLIEF